MLLIEIPVGLLLGLTSAFRGGGRPDERTVASPPPLDWVPVFWLGGFTCGVLVIAVIFLYSAHPFSAAVQLLVAATALCFTIAAWHHQYERAHPPPLPTKAGMPRTASHHMPDRRAHHDGDRSTGPTGAVMRSTPLAVSRSPADRVP